MEVKINSLVLEKQIKEIVKEFAEVFRDKLGEYSGESVTLKENVVSKYFKPRAIPFTLKAKVEAELQHLVDNAIFCPIQKSEWGTP